MIPTIVPAQRRWQTERFGAGNQAGMVPKPLLKQFKTPATLLLLKLVQGLAIQSLSIFNGFGFMEKTGIELSGEATGIFHDPKIQ